VFHNQVKVADYMKEFFIPKGNRVNQNSKI